MPFRRTAEPPPKHVSVIGTGDVGCALGRGFADAGHETTFGSGDPHDVEDGLLAATGAAAVDRRAAAERGEVVVLAVPGDVVVDLAADLADAVAGKPVVDPTNEFPRPDGGESLAERVQSAAPAARVVKAFNAIGADHMADPQVGGAPATAFVAGDDPDAVDVTTTLAADVGFETVVAGGLDAAVHLEDLARLWVQLSREYGRDVAFRLLRG